MQSWQKCRQWMLSGKRCFLTHCVAVHLTNCHAYALQWVARKSGYEAFRAVRASRLGSRIARRH